jgi:thiosulfate/3-mercaptopyruvate sulfurtransferase
MPHTRLITTVIVATAGIGGAVSAQAPTGEPLVVSAAWLAQHAGERGIVILQAGGSESEYRASHIAGSRYVPDLGMSGHGSMEMQMAWLPSAHEFRARLEALGISDGSHVIVTYPGDNLPMATRTILLLQYTGHDNVSLLDGGLDAWTRASLPLTKSATAPAPGHVTVTLHPELLASREYVQASLHTPKLHVVDARTPNYYGGAAMMGMSAGHIPGAVNVPFNSLEDAQGLLLPVPTLAERLRSVGVASGDTVVAYCHSGFQATVVALVARLTGHPVRMYFGSFHDWSAHQLPTEGGK